MMRVTNSMIVRRSKTNINANRAQVDKTNNQMATQKKIVKPSDNPIIAIRSLRLRSELSTITQYYENNIPDTESWMDVTETALTNMKDILTKAYEQTVYGSTDSLNQDNRKTILKELQALQEQIYSEGNSDYAGRTVFTGYKTNQTLTFINSSEAQKAEYQITERFNYKDIERKKYYPNGFSDTSTNTLFETKKDPVTGQPLLDDDGNPIIKGPDRFTEVDDLNRVRLSYDKLEGADTALTFIYNNGIENIDVKYNYDAAGPGNGNTIGIYNMSFNGDGTVSCEGDYQFLPAVANGQQSLLYKKEDLETDTAGNLVPKAGAKPVATLEPDATGSSYTVHGINDYVEGDVAKGLKTGAQATVVTAQNDGATPPAFDHWQVKVGDNDALDLKYKVSNTVDLEKDDYGLVKDGTIVFDQTAGELIFNDGMANNLNAQQTEFKFTYEKKGFDNGELKPEYYFDCVKHTENRDINYVNYTKDSDGNDVWKTEGIYYNIAGGQQMQINTEAREVFNSDIRRDMDDLISIVQAAIDAQTTVDDIQAKIDSGMYDEKPAEMAALKDWLYEAETQLAYANQNMHDTYKSYITNFKGYLDTTNLAITDIGGRAERVSLTKNRMSVQQSTFKDLKASNEDMDLSELVINYSAASVAYQAALQAAAKIDKMSLLNYL